MAPRETHEDLLDALEQRGFVKTTPIQSAVLPYALEGKDVIGCAVNGAAAGQPVEGSKPTLEINPEHVLVQRLASEADEARAADLAQVLYDQALLAEGGKLGPFTWEKPQPARSNTGPSSRIMVMPSPCKVSPAGLVQRSTTNAVPSRS